MVEASSSSSSGDVEEAGGDVASVGDGHESGVEQERILAVIVTYWCW